MIILEQIFQNDHKSVAFIMCCLITDICMKTITSLALLVSFPCFVLRNLIFCRFFLSNTFFSHLETLHPSLPAAPEAHGISKRGLKVSPWGFKSARTDDASFSNVSALADASSCKAANKSTI